MEGQTKEELQLQAIQLCPAPSGYATSQLDSIQKLGSTAVRTLQRDACNFRPVRIAVVVSVPELGCNHARHQEQPLKIGGPLRHKPEWDKSNLFAILILSSDACPEPIDENEADHLQLQYHPVSICCLPRCKSSEHIADPEMAPESIPDHCVLLGRAEKGAHQIARRKTP
eukprot:2131273-Rhodomonas_salina.1